MELVNTKKEIIQNALKFHSYRDAVSAEDKEFYRDRMRLGNIFICFGINNEEIFCPSRFARYKDNNRQAHEGFAQKHGTHTTQRIDSILWKHVLDKQWENKFKERCAEVNVIPADRTRHYWPMPMSDDLLKAVPLLIKDQPGELPSSKLYIEGATKQVTINAYERNEKARIKCIEYYGCQCFVCGLIFKDHYGDIGADFIHVHHLIPVSVMKKEYELDAIADLRPVCPNCHAMLHKKDPPFSVEELKGFIGKNQVQE